MPSPAAIFAAWCGRLAQSRRRGYTVSDEDVTPGIAAIGAPVLDADGRPVAALSVGGLRPRILPPRPEHVGSLLAACRALSARLGHDAGDEAHLS